MKRKKILFVCTGNTCRSPMAEMILRGKIKERKIKWWDVASRGISAEVKSTLSENARAVLEEKGVPVSESFRPRQLTQKIIESSEVVVTMISSQRQLLEDCGNIICVKDLCGYDVPDPFGGSVEVYRITRDVLDAACDKILEKYIINNQE